MSRLPAAMATGAVEAAFRLQATQHRATRAQHVHGVRVGGEQFQRGLERVRQPAHPGEERAVFGQLRAGGQLAVEEQVGDLLEPGLGGEVFDGVAAVGKAEAFLADGADGRFTGVDPGESAGFVGGGLGVSLIERNEPDEDTWTRVPRLTTEMRLGKPFFEHQP